MLTKQTFKYLWGKTSTSSWIKEVQKDLEKKNNTHAEEAIEREVFRAKVLKMEGVQGERERERETQVHSGLKTGCLLYTSNTRVSSRSCYCNVMFSVFNEHLPACLLYTSRCV